MAKKQGFDNEELSTYYNKIFADVEKSTNDDSYGAYVFSRVKGGQKKVFNKANTEIRNFDMSFLDVIESVYPAITKIMRDPKKSIRYEEEVVAVEKAKKVNSQTVRHLSSHTQLIKEIKKNGDVIPSKVMTTYAEEELAIYENRFIKSLVKRMEGFLENRYEIMKDSLESFETHKLNVNNEFLMSGQKVSINFDIQIKNDLTSNLDALKAQFNRLLYVRDMVQSLKGTDFMRTLAKAREVLPPIMKTNIILHNPDFKLCYGLWLYLDRCDMLSNEVEAKEKSYKFSNVFEKDINECMALALTSFLQNRQIEGIYSSKSLGVVKPPKVQNNEEIELELNFDADNKKIEDYRMNEVLLNETAKFFEASMSGMERTGNTYNESIKVVYRQMLDMLDQIYPRTFGVADEELDDKNPYAQLEFLRKKKMVYNIVRQQKQMNIARMGREEKIIEKNMEKLQARIKAEEDRERERLEKERQRIEAERLKAEEAARKKEERRKNLEKQALDMQRAINVAEAEKAKAKEKASIMSRKEEGKDAGIRAMNNQARDRLRQAKLDKLEAIRQAEEERLRAEEEERKRLEEEERKRKQALEAFEEREAVKATKALNMDEWGEDYIPTDEELAIMEAYLAEDDDIFSDEAIAKLEEDKKAQAEAEAQAIKAEEERKQAEANEKARLEEEAKKALAEKDRKKREKEEAKANAEAEAKQAIPDLSDMPDDYIPTDEEIAQMEQFLGDEDDLDALLAAIPEKEAPAEQPEEDDLDALLNAIPEKEAPAETPIEEQPDDYIPSDEEIAQMEQFLDENPNEEADDLDALLNAIPEKEAEAPIEEAPSEDLMPTDEELQAMQDFIDNNSEDDLDALLNAIPEKEAPTESPAETPIEEQPDDYIPSDEEIAQMEQFLDENPAEDNLDAPVENDLEEAPSEDLMPTDEELQAMQDYLDNNPDAVPEEDDLDALLNAIPEKDAPEAPAETPIEEQPDDYIPSDEELQAMQDYLDNNPDAAPEEDDLDALLNAIPEKEEVNNEETSFEDLPDDYIPSDEELAEMEKFLAEHPEDDK